MNICIQKNLHTYLHTHTHTHTRNEPAGCGRRWGCDCTWCRRWQLRRHALGAYRGSWQSCSSPPGAPCISSHIRTQGSRLIWPPCACMRVFAAAGRPGPQVACCGSSVRTRDRTNSSAVPPVLTDTLSLAPRVRSVKRPRHASHELRLQRPGSRTRTQGPCVGHLPPSAAVLRHVLSLLLRQVQQRHHPCGAEPTALVSDAICQRLRGCRQEARSYVAHVLSVVRMCATKPRVHF